MIFPSKTCPLLFLDYPPCPNYIVKQPRSTPGVERLLYGRHDIAALLAGWLAGWLAGGFKQILILLGREEEEQRRQ